MITPEQLVDAEDSVMYLKKALREARLLEDAVTKCRAVPRTVTERVRALEDDLVQLLESANDKFAFVKGVCGCTCPNPVLHFELAKARGSTKIDPTQCVKPEALHGA